MWNLLVFALIGLFAGAAARLFYPGRQPMRIVGTLLLGVAGALLGGMISWGVWTELENQFHSGNLFLALLGAMLAIVIWVSSAYAWDRRRSVRNST